MASPTFSSVVALKGSGYQVQIQWGRCTGGEVPSAAPASPLSWQRWCGQREDQGENKIKSVYDNSYRQEVVCSAGEFFWQGLADFSWGLESFLHDGNTYFWLFEVALHRFITALGTLAFSVLLQLMQSVTLLTLLFVGLMCCADTVKMTNWLREVAINYF